MITTAAVATMSILIKNATTYSKSSILEKSGIDNKVFSVTPSRLSVRDSNFAAATIAALFLSTAVYRPSFSLSMFSIGAPLITSLMMLTITGQFTLVYIFSLT